MCIEGVMAQTMTHFRPKIAYATGTTYETLDFIFNIFGHINVIF